MASKKEVRAKFRRDVLGRDKYHCRCCGVLGSDRQDIATEGAATLLDAHHITSRDDMPNGGYVKENGITVCDECHKKCEQFWITGVPAEGFAPADLYILIGSSFEVALAASERLK